MEIHQNLEEEIPLGFLFQRIWKTFIEFKILCNILLARVVLKVKGGFCFGD
jgi:hypothetical protein